MEPYFNEELIEKTYLWARSRLADEEDAKELSQDILCEALTAIRRGRQITAFYPWFWRLADKRLRIFLRV